MSNQEPISPQPIDRSFDQIVKGNVCIKKLKKKHMYRITFSKIGEFLVYQVWDKDNVGDQNSKRRVYNLSAQFWINDFNQRNRDLEEKGKPLFTPTTIIETVDQEQYACVIHKAYFNSHRVVFTVSTKEIKLANNCSKKLINIQPGYYNNMRFDIDAAKNGDGIVYHRSDCSFPYFRQYGAGGDWSGSICAAWWAPPVAKVIHESKGPNGEPPGEHNWTGCEISKACDDDCFIIYTCPP